MSKTTIRPFEKSDSEAVFSLYRSVFGEAALRRFRRRWKWQFFENPPARRAPSRMRVAESGGDVVGFVAAFPVRQKLLDREIFMHRTCDFMVAPEARSEDPTIAIRLLKGMNNGAGDVLWVGMGYSEEHGRMRRLLGHEPLDAIPFYVRPYDLRAIARFLASSGQAWTFLAGPVGSAFVNIAGTILNAGTAVYNSLKRPRGSREYRVEPVTEAGPEFDQLWSDLASSFPIIAVRDRNFVQWRFFDDPVFEHRVFLATSTDGRAAGYLSMRASVKGEMRIGRILDIFCPPRSEEVVGALLRAALEHLRDEGVHVVSCLGLHPAIRRIVRRYLYVSPPQRQHPALCFWRGAPELEAAVYDPSNWHLSHADGDEGFAP